MRDVNWKYNADLQPTNIAGGLSKDQVKAELARVRGTFEGKRIAGYYDGQPATYNLIVNPVYTGPYLLMESELRGNWKQFIKPEHQKSFWKSNHKYLRHTDLLLSHKYADIFPHHSLAVVFYKEGFIRDIPEGLSLLENLGYEIVFQRKDHHFTDWGTDARLEFLRFLRYSATQSRAFDKRAEQIFSVLQQRLPSVESYYFGFFVPKRILVGGRTEPYNSPEKDATSSENEKVVNPVKYLEEIPTAWLPHALEQRCKNLPLSRAVGLTSRVQTREGLRHIPMIDFASEIDDPGDAHLKALGVPGMIVHSGRAGHFYGFELQTEDEWRDFIQRLKHYDWVDPHWPDLQLEQGYSMLRLTPCRHRLYQPCFARELEGVSPGRKKSVEETIDSLLPALAA